MKPITKPQQPILGISIHPDAITLSVINRQAHTLSLQQFKHITLPNYVTMQHTLFNISFLSDVIKTTMHEWRLQKSYCVIALGPHGYIERIIGLTTQHPSSVHLDHHEATPLIWDYQLLTHHHYSGKSYFYLCALPRTLLFQYQLLALQTNLTCIAIIPQCIAFLNALNYLFPETVSSTTITNHATLQNTISYGIEHFDRSLINTDQTIKKRTLVESIGLYMTGLLHYE